MTRLMKNIAGVAEAALSQVVISTAGDLQGHPERMLKVNPFARALIFTKSGFSGVFWDEK